VLDFISTSDLVDFTRIFICVKWEEFREMGGVSLTECDTDYFVIWQCRILHHKKGTGQLITPASFAVPTNHLAE
jgi:hypothetical protein